MGNGCAAKTVSSEPVIRGDILAADGDWKAAEFLLDTGADRTVLSALLLAKLDLTPIETQQEYISGLGGAADSVIVETQIQSIREGGDPVIFRGHYAAATEVDALDISVLGRDVTDLFAVIVDRHGDIVCMLGQRHRYSIEQV